MKGSELDWPVLGSWHGSNRRLRDVFAYKLFQPSPGPSWTPENFDFDRDYKRFGLAASLENADHPDLSAFNAAGGKLILYVGLNDVLGGTPQLTINYYEAAEKLAGNRAAALEFMRLFTIPGMAHCGGGNGANTVDYLSALEQWVEHGKTPDKLIAVRMKPDVKASAPRSPASPAAIDFSRPVYPYPVRTRYLGRGDPKNAESYGPHVPKRGH